MMINLHHERLNKIEDDGDAMSFPRTKQFQSLRNVLRLERTAREFLIEKIFAPRPFLRRVRRERPTQNANSFDEFYLQIVEILL